MEHCVPLHCVPEFHLLKVLDFVLINVQRKKYLKVNDKALFYC